MTTATKVLLVALALSVALNVWCWVHRRPDPPAPVVDAPEVVVRQDEPPVDRGLAGDVVHGRERPATEVTRAPGAAAGQVAAFCRAAGWVAPGATAEGVGLAPPAPSTRVLEPPRPISGQSTDPVVTPADAAPRGPAFPEALALRSGTFSLWLVTPDGALERARWERVHDPMEARLGPDGWFVRSSPWWWVDEALGLTACAAGGVGSAMVARETDSDLLTWAPVAAGCALGVKLVVF